MVVFLVAVGLVVVLVLVRFALGDGPSRLELMNQRKSEQAKSGMTREDAEAHFERELQQASNELLKAGAEQLADAAQSQSQPRRMAALRLLSSRTLELPLQVRIALHQRLSMRYRNAPTPTRDYTDAMRVLNTIEAHWQTLLQHYPAVYDLKRACRTQLASGTPPFEHLVVSRLAEDDRNLRPGVQAVVGALGSSKFGAERSIMAGKRLFINLWEGEQRKVLAADIDELHIYGGHEGLPYDWAINAVVEMIQNRMGRACRLPVHLVGSPPLSANSRRMLATVAKQIEEVAW